MPIHSRPFSFSSRPQNVSNPICNRPTIPIPNHNRKLNIPLLIPYLVQTSRNYVPLHLYFCTMHKLDYSAIQHLSACFQRPTAIPSPFRKSI